MDRKVCQPVLGECHRITKSNTSGRISAVSAKVFGIGLGPRLEKASLSFSGFSFRSFSVGLGTCLRKLLLAASLDYIVK